MTLAYWLNTVWMLGSAWEARAFRRATRQVACTQADLLADLVHRNRDTAFGRAHHFERIRTPREYQDGVPLSHYEDYREAITRIGAGEPHVLTREHVDLLEPTSGTTGGEKLIPFTATLRRQFQRAVAVWIHDLFCHRPGLRRGRAYWSISPCLGPERTTPGGIAIGFADDTAYLGGLERWVLSRLLVRPSPEALRGEIDSFRVATLCSLLMAKDLLLISVWSPTFLSALFPLLQQAAGLVPGQRGHEVRRLLGAAEPLAAQLQRIWPRLTLLSCWTDAAASRFVPAVRELFPHVEIQPKGLLATEGCVTFPLLGRPVPVLAIRSHFFEFEELPERQRPRLAHEVDRGGRYRVVLTTGGGLYRYRLGDEVEVVGFENQCPLLRFLGKADRVSDLVGEKLAEAHVRAVLESAFAALGISPTFAMLAPEEESPPRYVLFVQDVDVERVSELRAAVQAGLEENPHYRYAVGLRQLGALAVELLPASLGPAWLVYERQCLARPESRGDQARRPQWMDRLAKVVTGDGSPLILNDLASLDTPASTSRRASKAL